MLGRVTLSQDVSCEAAGTTPQPSTLRRLRATTGSPALSLPGHPRVGGHMTQRQSSPQGSTPSAILAAPAESLIRELGPGRHNARNRVIARWCLGWESRLLCKDDFFFFLKRKSLCIGQNLQQAWHLPFLELPAGGFW